MTVECHTCDRWFVHIPAAMQHMDAVGHWRDNAKCESCSIHFFYEDDVYNHMDDENHWAPKFECEACTAMFTSQQAARRHMDSTNHWRHHWCEDCERGFQNANNLRQHLNSSTHRAGSIHCPFCSKPHTTASGIVHHLETNSCPNAKNLNRQKIYEIINRSDTRGVITNKQLTWHSEQNGDHIASTATWNGRQYECYLCHRGYNTLRSLNQHLDSPAHKQKIYHCFGRACSKQFTALAQLFNHLESESCGATRFNVVQQNASDILTGRRMIAF
ncbi:hypothetical protein M409DRAFT_15646 [Zasmidium cellare ATCC 36951]|uniref:C2H2-type domain-containing protein n=1 Tax=Zasmidium cellare ATCC 36951 TaxID=1080233 RepID=A0A6A6D1X3_ZASCE|nr:uncharacterized protein M409DRAFT_15646 [Zasmidium cellare ATCC 36951]KAF2173361.1 hypothetical protein M409DRAFT_15646 [Zasmidium cellare ATCC 36951]